MFIPYGKNGLELPFDIKVETISPAKNLKALSDEAVLEKLHAEAVMSFPLRETLEDARRVLIVLPDATRKSGAEQILPEILNIINELGKDFSFIIAVGTHRQPTEAELSLILTPEIYAEHKDRVIAHNASDYKDMDFYGITKRKTTVLINKAYREHDTIITIGSVSYHYFAGYGGGRKLIFPGMAGEKAITANHRLALDPGTGKRHERAVTGNLRNNPVHDDMVETIMIARSSHTFFAVNTLLDKSGKIAEMVCGDLFVSHIQAAGILDEYCGVTPEKQYDLLVLSAGGSPKDINMVQAQKYLDRVLSLVKPGGDIVFFAECPDGYGNSYFQEFFDLGSSEEMLGELLKDYRINRQTAFNLKSNLEKYNVYLFSSFSKEDSERMGFLKADDLSVVKYLADKAQNAAFVSHPGDIFIK